MPVDFASFAAVLRALGVPGEVRELPEPAPTAATAAAQLGCEVGHPAPIRTLVDTWLDKYDQVWAAAGHAHTVFPTSFGELISITNGTAADVGG